MFEQLRELLAGYFHQDWDLEFANHSEVAHHFALQAEPSSVESVLGQLAILAASADEAKIEDILTDAGCYYRPTESSLEEWLKDFSAEISQVSWKRRIENG